MPARVAAKSDPTGRIFGRYPVAVEEHPANADGA